MTSGVESVVTLQKKRGNVERLTALRKARTAWVKRPDGALPLFIGEGDHEVVMGCRIHAER